VALDSSGDVWVADTGNNVVEEIAAVGGVIPASPTITTLASGFALLSGIASR
jgi:large repetitive protein